MQYFTRAEVACSTRRASRRFRHLATAVGLLAGSLGMSAANAEPLVRLDTSAGAIVLELDSDRAPGTVENFVQYVKDGFYSGIVFHRVIPNFMIQGGGFDADMNQKDTRGNIQNEADNGLKNDRGSIAMARTPDPHSASAQFFINLKDNDFLNHTAKDQRGWGYAVFGKVVEGIEVVDAIAGVATTTKGPYADVPAEAVVIESATLVE